MSISRRLVIVLPFCLAGLPGAGLADDSDAPVLRIEGRIAGGQAAAFTRAQLEAMGLATIRTSTPWHDGLQTFEGVPLTRLMQTVKAQGGTIEVMALNRYRTLIPMDDFERHGPILAVRRNGAYMPVRDKGPFFIIYPYDSSAALRTEQYYARSAWQVASLTVR